MAVRQPYRAASMPSLHALPSSLESMSIGAHFGISSDASSPIGLIALSRLARTKEMQTLVQRAATPIGKAILAAVLAVVLRVATTTVDDGLSEANMLTMFNLPGSAAKYQSQYGDFGSLQSRLSWPRFRQLVAAMLDSLNAGSGWSLQTLSSC